MASKRHSRIFAPVFVVGCPRSGTTILGACLASHSALGSGEESMFLRHLARIYYGLFQGHNKRNWAPLQGYVQQTTLIESLGALADDMFESLLVQIHKPRYLDHTPWYVHLVDFINLLYDDALFIHVIRDGRSVVESLTTSYQKGFSWAGETIAARTGLWARAVVAGRKAIETVGDDRYTEILYEDLCRMPEVVLENVLRRVGLSMEASVLEPLARVHADPSRKDPTLAKIDDCGNVVLRPKIVGNVWPAKWSAAEKEEFASTGEGLLKDLGYQC